MDEEELFFQLALSKIKGVGFGVWSKLIQSFGSAKKIFSDIDNIPIDNIHNQNLRSIYRAISKKETISESEQILKQHLQEDIQIISFYDKHYPQNLKEISSPPCFLYVQGNLELNKWRSLSVVGSRMPSDYGKAMVKKLVRELRDYGVVIVSGLAYGIDFLSHDQAIKNDIPTIAILAGGLDKIYPTVHKPLADSIVSHNGAIMSEYPLGTIPENFHFPARNRIIAGFSDATLVVEAGAKSGSNITALCANDYNKEVFAVPGNIGNPLSVGCNNLIKNNQAHLITCAQDIASVMNWDKHVDIPQPMPKQNPIPENLDGESKKILLLLQQGNALSVDELLEKTDVQMDKLSMLLLQLELLGLVKILPGNRYENT